MMVTQWIREIALSDSQTAFRSLYMAYFDRMMRFVLLYVSNPIEAEEILSDIFLAIWTNRKSLPEISHFDSYIYTIVRYKIVSHYRTKTRKDIDFENMPFDLFISTETTPEDELISKEEIDQLNEAINALPTKCKMAFKLVREDNLKYKDVAVIMNISIKTLEAHLATAVKKLRESLKKNPDR